VKQNKQDDWRASFPTLLIVPHKITTKTDRAAPGLLASQFAPFFADFWRKKREEGEGERELEKKWSQTSSNVISQS